MHARDLCPGRLVHSAHDGPSFRRGALFQIVSLAANPSERSFVGCKAVGRAPFKLWYFLPEELVCPATSESPR
jgi:hypothetical protein